MESDANTNGSSCSLIVKSTLIVLLILVGLAGIVMALINLHKTRLHRNYCRKDDCKYQARSMKQNMDTSVDPCEHFFNFTCGNYKSESVGTENWVLVATKLLYQRYLDTVLGDTQKFILPEENLKAFHDACINIYIGNINYLNDLKNVLMELRWPPLTKNWNSSAVGFNWLNLTEKLIKMGFTSSLFKFSSRSLPEETIVCECGPPSTLFDLTNEEEAKNKMEYLIGLLKGDQNLANEILQILIEIQKIKNSNIHPAPDRITLGEVEKRWKINFINFCISILPTYMNITQSTHILLMNNCPALLVDLLKRSEKRPVAGYMLIDGIAEFEEYEWIIDVNARIKNRQYKKLPHDTRKSTKSVDLDDYCYNLNMELLPDLWLYIYVKRYSSKAKIDKAFKMLNLIRDEARALINNSWLSDSSKKVIFNKFSKQIYMIDHDEEYVTDDYIQSTFGDLKFNGSDMIESVMHLKAHRFLRQWKIFTVKYEKREIFRQHAQLEVNAFNDRFYNFLSKYNFFRFVPTSRETVQCAIHKKERFLSIVHDRFSAAITASCLMPMLYSDDFEDSLNFGGLGSILAHELFHTIDNASLEFDDKHSATSWMNEKDRPLFDNKVKCFVKQYSKYKLTSKRHVDGHNTIDENLADSGIILAYRAYLKWLETNKVKRLPGLGKYNNRQIFWIALGNIWCSVYNKEHLESDYVKREVHSIGKFRVLGTLSNFEEFSKDFHCPAHSGMNRKNKCKLYH